jgi:hypothetical protein
MTPAFRYDQASGLLLPFSGGPSLALGVGSAFVKPDATNTGIPAGTTLTEIHGDMVITVDGTIIEDKDVFGFIDVRARNVIIRRSRVRGSGPGTGNTGLIIALNAACVNLLVEYCELRPDFPSYWLDGIIGDNFTARYNKVYNVVDGFGINGTGVLNTACYSNWVYDLSYFSPDPNHTDNQTHNDCIQVFGGDGAIIAGNRLDCFLSTTVGTLNNPYTQGNAAIQLNQGTAPLTNLAANDNWVDGGNITVNGLGVTGDIGDLLRNRCGRGSHSGQVIGFATATVCNTGTGADVNVYDDNGTPVPIYRA